MIELRQYKQGELNEVLGIGKNTWNNRIDDIHSLMKEWPGLKRKELKNKAELNNYYRMCVDLLVNDNLYTNAMMLAKQIYNNENKYNQQFTTIHNYVNKIVKQHYSCCGSKRCFKYRTGENDCSLEQMTSEEIGEWCNLWRNRKNFDSQKEHELYCKYENDEISVEEFDFILQTMVYRYPFVRNAWMNKYGYYPKKISKLIPKDCAWGDYGCDVTIGLAEATINKDVVTTDQFIF